MTVLGFFIGLIVILQIIILVGICRTNNKLNELDDFTAQVHISSTKNTVYITRILNQMTDEIAKIRDKKKHKKKKGDTIYANNKSES